MANITNPRITVHPITGSLCVDGRAMLWTFIRPGKRTVRLTSAIEGDRFLFQGGSYGSHSLDIGSTSPERLIAHWRGYVQATDVLMTTAWFTGAQS